MNRPWTIGLGLGILLVATVGIAVAIGSLTIHPTDVYRVLAERLVG